MDADDSNLHGGTNAANTPSANQQRSTPGRAPPGAAPEPSVRARWSPRPEQIHILESIFNSGMVNPPKEETVRIRKLLERFGAVGDANVFYWFQNRRSRSRRRQRQLQASLMADPRASAVAVRTSSSSSSNNSSSVGGGGTTSFPCPSSSASSSSSSSSSAAGFLIDDGADDLLAISHQMGFVDNTQTTPPFSCSPDLPHLQHQPGQGMAICSVTVFIDGVAAEVPRGPIDLRAIFGQNVMLVHSSGEILPANEHGILIQSLQMGESYFLVAKPN